MSNTVDRKKASRCRYTLLAYASMASDTDKHSRLNESVCTKLRNTLSSYYHSRFAVRRASRYKGAHHKAWKVVGKQHNAKDPARSATDIDTMVCHKICYMHEFVFSTLSRMLRYDPKIHFGKTSYERKTERVYVFPASVVGLRVAPQQQAICIVRQKKPDDCDRPRKRCMCRAVYGWHLVIKVSLPDWDRMQERHPKQLVGAAETRLTAFTALEMTARGAMRRLASRSALNSASFSGGKLA